MPPSNPDLPETHTERPAPDGGGADPDSLLVSLCRQWNAARLNGRSLSPTELCTDCPDLLPDLIRAIEVLGVLDNDVSTLPIVSVEISAPKLPGYDFLGEIGRGGMGIVYRARHLALNRVVAIKLIADAGLVSPSRLIRFRQEAEAVARLQHPNIVQIFETGVINGRPYLALEYVDGGTLRRRQSGVPQSPRDAAQLVETVARAIHHAHEHRIVHRDIKPANILLTATGVPKITDFGLARALDVEGGLTLTADVLGTPAYAAPEQLHRRPEEIGPATDVYGLGATLYELLAGRPPFDAGSLPEVIRQVADQDPTPLRRLRPGCPRDLGTICQKCLEKNPARRYPSALALAEDLRRFLADEPILARPLSPFGRGWRWAKRNPAVAGLLGTIGLVLTVAAVGGAVLSSSLALALKDAKDDRDRAVRAEEEGERKLFAAYIAEANAIRSTGQPGQRYLALDNIRQALTLAEKIKLTPADKLAARNAAAAALCQPDLCPGPDWDANAPAEGIPPDTISRARAMQFRPPGNNVAVPVRFVSPTGRFVIVAPRTWAVLADNPFEVWKIDGPEPVRVFTDVGVFQQAVAFSSDERKLAIGRKDGTVTVFATADGSVLAPFSSGSEHLLALTWHPDNSKLAVILGDERHAEEEQRVWDTTATPPKVWATVRHVLATGNVAFHPSGHVLATADANGRVCLWDLPTGRMVTCWKTRLGSGVALGFGHAGNLLVGTDWSGTLRLWDTGTGRELTQLTHGSNSVIFTAPERLGNPSHHEGRYFDCRVSAGRERRILNRITDAGFEPAGRVAPHPDGRLLAMTASDGIAFVDLATGRTVATLQCDDRYCFQFDSHGGLWTHCTTGNVPLLRWPVTADPDHPHRLTIGPPEFVATNLAGDVYSTSADGKVVAVPRRAYGAQVVSTGPFAGVRTFATHLDVRSTFLSPDGRLVVTRSFHADDGTDIRLKVWDVPTGRHLANIPVEQASNATEFSADNRWLYTAGGFGPAYRRWDLSAIGEKMVPRWEETPPRPFGAASPDGRIVARAPDVNGIALHDATDDRELVRLPLVGGYSAWYWSSDGTRLYVVGADDQKLYAYDLRLIRRGLAELRLDWDHPPYSPAPAWENDPFTPSLEVRVLGADTVASLKYFAAVERTRAAADIAANPLDPGARTRLGLWLLNDGRAAEAFPHLVAAVALDPHQTGAWLPLAEAAVQTGRWAAGAEAAAKAIDVDPQCARAHHLRGLAEVGCGRHPEAIRAYSTALELTSNRLALLLDRADAYRAAGDLANAGADTRRVDELIARSPTQGNNLAWELVTGPPGLRNPRRALEVIEKAITHAPNNSNLLNTLGIVEYRNELYKKARTTLERSLVASAGTFDGYDLFFLAMCHYRLGEPVKARQRFDEAMRWIERAKALNGVQRAELAEFREEAETELGLSRR